MFTMSTILRPPAPPRIRPYPESMKNSASLEKKVCLVTGGTRGIGRAIAEMLLAEGALVVVCGRWPDSVTRAVSEMEAKWPGKVKGKAADVCEHEQVRALFESSTAKRAVLTYLSTTPAREYSPKCRRSLLRSGTK